MKHPSIQNYRHAKDRKCKTKLKLYLDTLEIYWKGVNVTFNGNKVNLLKLFMKKLGDKFKMRHMMKKKPLLFHAMLKQGLTQFTLASSTQKTV